MLAATLKSKASGNTDASAAQQRRTRSTWMLGPASVFFIVFSASILTAVQAKDISPPTLTWEVGPATPLPVSGLPMDLWSSAAPDDPNRLLVCTFEADGAHARHHSVAYVSLDSGNTWMKTLDDTDSDFVSEPSCATGWHDKAYFSAGVSNTSHGEPRHKLGSSEIFSSVDGGLTWDLMHRYPFIDWTSLAVGQTPADSVYLFGHLMAIGAGDSGSGEWREEIRPLLVSRDAGSSFSGPRFPSDQTHNSFRRGYPTSSVALEDGTVLALYVQTADAIPKRSSPLGFTIYEVAGERYEKVADVPLPPTIHDLWALSSQLAVDRGGPYSGRLYIAFQGVEAGHIVVGLAASDDRGRTWSTHVLVRAGRAGDPSGRLDNSGFASVAVNRHGIIGLEWMPPNDCPMFALSSDGGTSITPARELGRCHTGEVADVRAPTTIDLMAAVDTPNIEPGDDGSRVGTGFSVRLDSSLLWSAQIVADAAGRFHAFWPERQPDGTVEIRTATVAVGAALQSGISLERATEETTQSLLQVTKEKYYPETATFAIDATLENVGSNAMIYPTLVEANKGLSDCGEVLHLNASGLSDQGHAIYAIPRPQHKQELLPREKTLPFHLEIRVKGCEDRPVSLFERSRVSAPNRWGFYVLSVALRVYATKEPSRDN